MTIRDGRAGHERREHVLPDRAVAVEKGVLWVITRHCDEDADATPHQARGHRRSVTGIGDWRGVEIVLLEAGQARANRNWPSLAQDIADREVVCRRGRNLDPERGKWRLSWHRRSEIEGVGEAHVARIGIGWSTGCRERGGYINLEAKLGILITAPIAVRAGGQGRAGRGSRRRLRSRAG